MAAVVAADAGTAINAVVAAVMTAIAPTRVRARVFVFTAVSFGLLKPHGRAAKKR
jgi:hypothetical protein